MKEITWKSQTFVFQILLTAATKSPEYLRIRRKPWIWNQSNSHVDNYWWFNVQTMSYPDKPRKVREACFCWKRSWNRDCCFYMLSRGSYCCSHHNLNAAIFLKVWTIFVSSGKTTSIGVRTGGWFLYFPNQRMSCSHFSWCCQLYGFRVSSCLQTKLKQTESPHDSKVVGAVDMNLVMSLRYKLHSGKGSKRTAFTCTYSHTCF